MIASKSGRRSDPGSVGRQRRRAHAGAGVQHGEVDLLLGRVEIDEQVVDLVEHFLGARVRPVDLVDDDQRREPALEGLAQHEARLRERPLGGVDEQQHAVDHRERPLDFAAEIGVARRVDDIDEHVLVVDGGVLGQDRDAALALQVRVVHRALGDALVRAKDAALVQQRVDQRRLAVVDVRDDRHVAPKGVGNGRGGFLGQRHLTSITPNSPTPNSQRTCSDQLGGSRGDFTPRHFGRWELDLLGVVSA